MRSLLLACAVIAAAHAAAVASQDKCLCQFYNPYGYRGGHSGGSGHQLRALETRIQKVAAAVQEIRNYWDNTVVPQRAKFKQQTEDLQFRVNELQGNKCGKGKFDCGGDDHQCISNLAVCDGDHADCANHHDEDKAYCTLNAVSGTVLVADHISHDTCTKRRPKKVSIVITSSKRYGWFKNIVHLKANIVLDHSSGDVESTSSLPTDGYFSFANNELVLFPPEDDRLGVTCKFHGSDRSTCSGHILHEATLKECASFEMHEQK